MDFFKKLFKKKTPEALPTEPEKDVVVAKPKEEKPPKTKETKK